MIVVSSYLCWVHEGDTTLIGNTSASCLPSMHVIVQDHDNRLMYASRFGSLIPHSKSKGQRGYLAVKRLKPKHSWTSKARMRPPERSSRPKRCHLVPGTKNTTMYSMRGATTFMMVSTMIRVIEKPDLWITQAYQNSIMELFSYVPSCECGSLRMYKYGLWFWQNLKARESLPSVLKWKSEARPTCYSWKQNVNSRRKKVLGSDNKGSHFRSITGWRQRTRTIVNLLGIIDALFPINILIP